MSKTIKFTVDDNTAADIERCAVYRFGDGPSVLSDYAKLATVQLLRRDVPTASKGARTSQSTSDD
jgi:hypothetical protein